MIEEIAVVTKIDNNQVWIETKSTQGCGGCQQKSTCSTSVLDKLIHKRAVAVDCDIDIKTGDEVVVGIEESALIKASVLLYLLPLLVMVTSGALAQTLLPPASDLGVAGIALTSLGLALWGINKLQQAFFLPYFSRPVVLKKVAPPAQANKAAITSLP